MLGFGFKFSDLYNIDGIYDIDNSFLSYLKENNNRLFDEVVKYRAFKRYDSEVIIKIAICIEEFISKLFKIENELLAVVRDERIKEIIYKCRVQFTRKYVYLKYSNINFSKNDFIVAYDKLSNVIGCNFDELCFAENVLKWLNNSESELLHSAAVYAIYKINNDTKENLWDIFCLPQNKKTNIEEFTQIDKKNDLEFFKSNESSVFRDGFVDRNPLYKNNIKAMCNAKYCLFCHSRNKDTCSYGMKDSFNEFVLSSSGIRLSGCPLDMKISEINYLKSNGFNIGALALIIRDNPMCLGTGYRICNECSNSCIYQKQDPVNIPLIETNIIYTVINIRYGFEIYSFLTRWNPLKFDDFVPKKDSGKNFLVAGMGPAGYTLAHYLLNEGHRVAGIDGVKINQKYNKFILNATNNEFSFEPIEFLSDVFNDVGFCSHGFGGVSEYGITARWDKKFLLLIYILLKRRKNFCLVDGIRLGSNISIQQAFEMGFCHVAIATGSGKQNILPFDKSFVKGVRLASDFLMSLHLGRAFDDRSLFGLQIRMPIIVIGGGLTAIDAAIEAMNYYPAQVYKFARLYRALVARHGLENVHAKFSKEDLVIANEFLEHAKIIDNIKRNGTADIVGCLQNFGGVTVVYHKNLNNSNFCKQNIEEFKYALDNGLFFVENASLIDILENEFGGVKGVVFDIKNKYITIKARSVLLATGAKSNVSTGSDCNLLIKNSFIELEGESEKCFFVKGSDKKVSIFGDMHRYYAGGVAKAMSSAKNGFSQISSINFNVRFNINDFLNNHSVDAISDNFFKSFIDLFESRVVAIKNINENVFVVDVFSIMATINFKSGQFYRISTYSQKFYEDYRVFIESEGVAVTGFLTNKKKGVISFVLVKCGASSKVISKLSIGEKICVMGPTGAPTDIPCKKNVLLIGGGTGNASLISIATAMKEKECRVFYCGGYKNTSDFFIYDDIDAYVDFAIVCIENGKIKESNDKMMFFQGNVIDGLEYYNNKFSFLNKIEHVLIVGSAKMMDAFKKEVVDGKFMNIFSCDMTASINSPMQCMMKGVCGQCVQKHKIQDKVEYVYSCACQDQNLLTASTEYLIKRLENNSLQEKIANLIIDDFYCSY